MTLRLVLLPFGGVRPYLDALPGKRSPVACPAHRAAHPEATLADPIHDRRALAVVVGPARHRSGRCEAFRAGGQQEPGNPGRQDGAAGGEEVAAVEYDGGHVNSSWRPCQLFRRGYNNKRETPKFVRGRKERGQGAINSVDDRFVPAGSAAQTCTGHIGISPFEPGADFNASGSMMTASDVCHAAAARDYGVGSPDSASTSSTQAAI
jgi:hypothetical protein